VLAQHGGGARAEGSFYKVRHGSIDHNLGMVETDCLKLIFCLIDCIVETQETIMTIIHLTNSCTPITCFQWCGGYHPTNV
jgi:hypothetical protein